MKIDEELLKIAEKDLKASKILYEKRLFPQSIFYFQQSVEKANKVFALITNQITEKDLKNKIGHETINIYDKSLKHQKKEYKKIKESFSVLPELETIKLFQDFNIDEKLSDIDHYLSQIKQIKEDKRMLRFISVSDIRRFLREIQSSKKDIENEKINIDSFEITNEIWNDMKEEIFEQLEFLSKYDLKEFEEAKNNLDGDEIRLSVEKLIKNLFEILSITLPLSTSLYYLAIISLPHSIITRYPLYKLTPRKIYNNKLPIVRKLPDLIEVQSNSLRDLKMLNEKLEGKNAPLN